MLCRLTKHLIDFIIIRAWAVLTVLYYFTGGTDMDNEAVVSKNFIEQIIEKDLAE